MKGILRENEDLMVFDKNVFELRENERYYSIVSDHGAFNYLKDRHTAREIGNKIYLESKDKYDE